MGTNAMAYEETINLKDVCIYILRKWKLLLIAALIGAVLLGGYRALSEIRKEPESVLTQEEIEEKQNKLSSNQSTIQKDQTELPGKVAELAGLEEVKADYDATYEKAMGVRNVTPELITEIMDLNNEIADTQSQISSVSQRIDNLNSEIANLTAESESLQASLAETVKEFSVKNVVTGAILGAILGLFVICAYAFLRWYFDKSLKSAEDMKDRYGILPLNASTVHLTEEELAGRGKFARWLDKLDGIDGPVDLNAEYAITASKLELLDNAGGIAVTGTLDKELLEAVCAGIRSNMEDPAVDMICVDNPMHNPESMRGVKGRSVVLVERVGTSNVNEIHDLVEFLHVAGKAAILGAFYA